ncbi:MAG: hypothetical protein ACO1OO_03015 [Flavisolibacter sp.]
METKEMEDKIRLQVADVIINLNLIEAKLSDIIGKYINSPKSDFVREVLLSSLIVNFSSKLNILRYILKSEKIEPPQDFFKSVTLIMTKRNVVAHSESLLKIEAEVIDVDVDWNHDGSYLYPIYRPSEPNLPVINDGQINFENISMIIKDFTKYFEIAQGGLIEIEKQLFPTSESEATS